MTHATWDVSADKPSGGVRDPRRLEAVARAELEGHMRDPALNAVVATLRIACRVPIAVINVVTEDLQTYPAEVGVGAPCSNVPDAVSFCAEVVDTKAPVMVVDATAHATYAQNPLVLAGVVRAYAGFPLVDRGHVLGSVSIFDSRRRVFTMDELAVLSHQAHLASSVLALRRSVRTDTVTGIPNRRSLLDRIDVAIARARRQGDHVAVMRLDVRGLPRADDRRRDDPRDDMLVELVHRWREALRPTDTLARVGADEFAAVCGDLTTAEQAATIADRLIEVASDPLGPGQQSPPLKISIGIVLVRDAAKDAAGLLRAANAAVRHAKATGASCWSLED